MEANLFNPIPVCYLIGSEHFSRLIIMQSDGSYNITSKNTPGYVFNMGFDSIAELLKATEYHVHFTFDADIQEIGDEKDV